MYISIDVGGTNIRVAGATDLVNPVFAREPLRRKIAHNFDVDLDFMIDAALRLANGKSIGAVGIGTPGSPNEDRTRIASVKNITDWIHKPLVSSLSARLQCPVFYDNDAMAAGLGEAYYGHTKGSFDYLIWGTGIGGCAVRHKESGPAITVLNWHTHFKDWESDSGGAELAKTFGKPPEEFTAEEWKIVTENFHKHLAKHIKNHRPQTIVFGGGQAVRHPEVLQEAGPNLGIRIEVTKFGDDSGLMGGFGLIRRGLTSKQAI